MGNLADIDNELLVFLGVEVTSVVVGLVGVLALAALEGGVQVLIPASGVLFSIGTMGFSKIYGGEALYDQIPSGSSAQTSLLSDKDVEKPVMYGNGDKIGWVKKDDDTGVHIEIPGEVVEKIQGKGFKGGAHKLTEEDGLNEDHIDVREQEVILKRWPQQKELEKA